MKFLCPNCKSKYQISDEKIAGRTLKMDCRRCNHSIVIRGDRVSAPAEAPRRPASNPRISTSQAAPFRRSGSHVGPAPARSSRSSLGAEFRKNAAAPAGSKSTALDQWHVGIHDVPVGPMRREEIGQKIAVGAVNSDSLVWREGFDDWRPLKEVPELAALLRRGPPAIPSPSRGVSRPPTNPPASARQRQPAWTPRPDTPRPLANVVPIGGRLGAAAAPALDEAGELDDDDDPTRVGTALDLERIEEEQRIAREAEDARTAQALPIEEVQPLGDPFGMPVSPAAPPAPIFAPAPLISSVPSEPRRRGLPVGAYIAIAGAMAFGVALAVMVAGAMFKDEAPRVVMVQPPAPHPTETVAAREETVEDNAPAHEATGQEPTKIEVARPRRETGRAQPPVRETTTPVRVPQRIDPAEAARLAQFDDEGSDTPRLDVRARNDVLSEERQRANTELSAEQIRSVVNRERVAVQRCYETEARRAGQAPSMRLDVDVAIGGSGTVTSAVARGRSFGALSECVERTVRRWRFPPSGSTTRTSVPFVFQGRE